MASPILPPQWRRKLGMIWGSRLTLSTACASGLHAAQSRAVMMIEQDGVERVLVVAVESSLHPLFVGSFKRLGVLASPGGGVSAV